MAIRVVLGNDVEPDVGAGRSAVDGDPHRGAVGEGHPELPGADIHLLDPAQGHVTHQFVPPPAVAEDAVGLVDDRVTLDVFVLAIAPALTVRDQGRVQGLLQGAHHYGGQPVPQDVVAGDFGDAADAPIGVVPVAVGAGVAVLVVSVNHFVAPLCCDVGCAVG